jgi:hypothetical protein
MNISSMRVGLVGASMLGVVVAWCVSLPTTVAADFAGTLSGGGDCMCGESGSCKAIRDLEPKCNDETYFTCYESTNGACCCSNNDSEKCRDAHKDCKDHWGSSSWNACGTTCPKK